jgi:hypothetical protein
MNGLMLQPRYRGDQDPAAEQAALERSEPRGRRVLNAGAHR